MSEIGCTAVATGNGAVLWRIARGNLRLALPYLGGAVASYRSWGARRKLRLIEAELPELFRELGVQPTPSEFRKLLHDIQHNVRTADQLDEFTQAAADHQYVIPDVVCERDADGEWSVTIPDSHLPTIEVSKDYSHLLETDAIDPRDAVAQRKRTLLKIATEIVKHQQAFLEQGPEQLRPLMRQDIANTIGMHVATVSRAVKEKYIQTPSGVLPLAAFFSGGIASQDGTEGESSRAVHLRIKKLIEEENKSKPLSDQAIADTLAKEGLDISRRTVTKYRIADGIPSTRQRRVFAS